MKRLIILFLALYTSVSYSQTGVNTNNPKTVFHIDGSGNNSQTGTPSQDEQKDDVVITNSGSVGIGTSQPSNYSSLEIALKKGLRLPQLTTLQIRKLDSLSSSSKKNGLMIYNVDTKCINFWVKTEWIEKCGDVDCIPMTGTLGITRDYVTDIFVGVAKEYSAYNVENVSRYEWLVDDVVQEGEIYATFTYTPVNTDQVIIKVKAYSCDGTFQSAQIDEIPNDVEACQNTASGTLSISPANPNLIVSETTTFTANGGTNILSYQWAVNDHVQDETSQTFKFTPSDTNPVTITVTGIGCDETTTTTGTVTATPQTACIPVSGTPSISYTPLVVSEQSVFTVSGVSNAETYQWYVNNSLQSGQNGTTFTYTPQNTSSVTIMVKAIGCNSSSVSNSVTSTPTVACQKLSGTLKISPTTAQVNPGTTQKFTASGVTNAVRYDWKVGSQIVQSGVSSTYNYSPTTEGRTTITVTAYGSCDDTQSASTSANGVNTNFTCKSAGNWLKPGTNCTQYIKCVYSGSALFSSYTYTCPTTSKFNVGSRLCSATIARCPY
ncbi:hypothetical protein O2K51_07080 [Apibacter raozihei]|uniref:hypothetical protein n=1 Tax=Apibacter raozihei TaxID=2500547 RepID=UPI000FE300C2|nr:hypothetical protein [Apibacter raozihei]